MKKLCLFFFLLLNFSLMAQESDALLLFSRFDQANAVTTVYLLNATTGEERQLGDKAAWLPDGQLWELESIDEDKFRLSLMDVQSGAETIISEEFLAGRCSVGISWSPNAQYLVYSSGTETERFLNIFTISDRISYSIAPIAGLSSYTPSWSPDERYLLIGYEDGSSRLLAAEDGRELLSLGSNNTYPAFSPDGRFLAYQDEAIQLYELATAETRSLDSSANNLFWSPTGRYLILVSYINGERLYQIYDTESATLRPLDLGYRVEFAAWTSDASSMLLYADYETNEPKSIQIYEMATGAVETLFPRDERTFFWRYLRQNGNSLAISYSDLPANRDGEQRLALYNQEMLIELDPSLKDSAPWDAAPVFSWSPDGHWLSLNAEDGLYVYDTSSKSLEQLVPNTEVIENPFWSPDSRYLAFKIGQELQIWNSESKRIEQVIEEPYLFLGWQYSEEQPIYGSCWDGDA
jgi:Tol biopolymer transport system component